MGKKIKENVGMCASDSIVMKVDGQVAFLLDDKPWSVSDLPGVNPDLLLVNDKPRSVRKLPEANPDLLLYTPATTVIDGPLFAQNVTVAGYLKIGNLTLSPSSNITALQGPQGEPGVQGPTGINGTDGATGLAG
jgi:hypothetical protein